MAKKYYEVEIQFKETGTGEAEIVVPQVLADREWQYVLVHEGEPKAIVQVEAGAEDHKAIAADAACRSLTKKKMGELKKAYPAPKLKQKYRRVEVGLTAEEMEGEPILETLQTVRWRFYLIDIPVQTERAVYYVVPDKESGEWHVKREGSSEAISTHSRKDEAVAAATDLAKHKLPSQVKIHKKDGTFQREYTYGDDPKRSPG